MNARLLIIFFFIMGLPDPSGIYSQDITPPERPYITMVTIDSATGYTHIYWTESSSPDVMWYYLYYEANTPGISEGIKFDSLSPGNSFYNHQVVSGSNPLVYTITAIDSSGNESLRTPGFHQTVYLSLDYDSCNNAIDLRWTPYLGWGENLSGYRVFSGISGSGFGQPAGVPKNQNSFRLENAAPNLLYRFYVEAIKNDTLVSSSNLSAKYTYMPGPPDEFNLVSVSVLSPNTAEIRFEFIDTSGMNDFRLLRSIDRNADFITVAGAFNLSEGENTFTDSIITGVEKYYYRIGAVNSCGSVASTTNVGTNILLRGENTGDQNVLQWNFYEEWENGVEEYSIINLNDPANPLVINSAGSGDNSYTHDLSGFFGSGYSGQVAYQVIAKQWGSDVYSHSNIIYLDSPSSMAIPNAFTPNNDGKNDRFRPIFTLYPEKFLMVILDRYGIIVYKSEDPAEGWDGRINGGEMAIEGVYVYHIRYTSYTGTSLEKTGEITLFYP